MENSEILRQTLESALMLDRERQQRQYAEDHPDGKVNPSVTDIGRCPRAVWYSLSGYEPSHPPDVHSLINFLVGHATEDAIARLLQPVAKTAREIRVVLRYGDTETTGRADFLLVVPALKTLIELKTTKQRQASFLPQKEHVGQLNQYLHAVAIGAFEGLKPGEVETGVLAYIIKDQVRGKKAFHLFDVHYDPISAEAGLAHNDSVMALVHQGIIPDRPKGYTRKKYPCSYCDFEKTCWE